MLVRGAGGGGTCRWAYLWKGGRVTQLGKIPLVLTTTKATTIAERGQAGAAGAPLGVRTTPGRHRDDTAANTIGDRGRLGLGKVVGPKKEGCQAPCVRARKSVHHGEILADFRGGAQDAKFWRI